MENTIENAQEFLSDNVGSNASLGYKAIPVQIIPELLVAYANSVRPEVKLPTEEERYKFCQANLVEEDGPIWMISEIRRLNPGLNFVEPK